MIKDAFTELFPGVPFTYRTAMKYSGRFSDYNAHIRLHRDTLEVRMSRKWEIVSEEIRKGLVQHLLLKLLGRRHTSVPTIGLELYDGFIKNLSKYAAVTDVDPALLAVFDRVNTRYFNGMMSTPNLRWGGNTMRILGYYEYATDSITISKVLADDEHLLSYVLYHEMLHKKLQFKNRKGRTRHHTREFRALERQFEDPGVEKKLEAFLRDKKYGGWRKWLEF
ncbi:MAG: SprT-like domain-containing protein [Nanoarchaeota archaeon]